MKILKILLLFITVSVSAQQGGMWIPSLLKGMNEAEMKQLGGKLSAKDIYNVNKSSLKDAIGHFNGLSARGLQREILFFFMLAVCDSCQKNY